MSLPIVDAMDDDEIPGARASKGLPAPMGCDALVRSTDRIQLPVRPSLLCGVACVLAWD